MVGAFRRCQVSSNWSGVKVTALSAKPFLKVSCCDSNLASSSPDESSLKIWQSDSKAKEDGIPNKNYPSSQRGRRVYNMSDQELGTLKLKTFNFCITPSISDISTPWKKIQIWELSRGLTAVSWSWSLFRLRLWPRPLSRRNGVRLPPLTVLFCWLRELFQPARAVARAGKPTKNCKNLYFHNSLSFWSMTNFVLQIGHNHDSVKMIWSYAAHCCPVPLF